MTEHINTKPLKVVVALTNVTTALPTDSAWNKDGISIWNPALDGILHVVMGGSGITAATTDMYIQPNTRRTFRRNPGYTHLAMIYSAGAGSTAFVTPESAFPASFS